MNVDFKLILSNLGEDSCLLGGASTVIRNFYEIKYLVLK